MPGLGDLSPQGTIAVGILVGLISTSVQSLGLTLQRQSHLREDEKDYDDRKPAWKRPRWQAGMLMFVSSNLIGSTIQITTLPLPVLSTLQASGLVFNTAFATLLLKEQFTRYSAMGTIGTCAGAALIATFGAIGEPAHNLSQLIALLKEKSFIIWMAATLFVAVLTIAFSYLLKYYSSHRHIMRHWFTHHERPRSSSSAGSPQSAHPKRQFTSSLPRPMQLRLARLRLIRGLSYGLISGILSAHSLLMAKSAVELIVRTLVDHRNQFNRFESWLILLALVFFALIQLYYLHLGLRLCSTSVLYPFVFCIYNIIAILDGLIYFQQGSRLSGLDAGLVALGTVILLAGVLALSWRLDHAEPEASAHGHEAGLPGAPLAPGMGTFGPPSLGPTSPSSHRESVNDESAPLLRKRSQTPSDAPSSLLVTDKRDIWAALDDEAGPEDFLSSLPKAHPQFLRPPKRRSKSPTSQAASSASEQSGDDMKTGPPKPRRSSMKGARSASAGHADRQAGDLDITEPVTRKRGHTVHFETGMPSRYDLTGKARRRSSEHDAPDCQDENG
ncbi:hypothetical protein LTR05_006936 [Lithohypha guttulata]|uniref:Magnesium transporter NIPA8 n=1 Tax=Lithohypha guttulata TaxID=1690604 RepID=A0AAN7SW23_9EURO|nr:hypothetical protein LTR05_006936 [Lithohypha guttulata]